MSDARDKAGPHRWLRPLGAFLATLLVTAALAGPGLWGPSRNNHYAWVAQGWLEGRLGLEGDPPGYEKRIYDDWARLDVLELKDGTKLRGYPCRTQACETTRRETRRKIEPYVAVGQPDVVEVDRFQIRERRRSWYVSFPPGPAVLMLPLVAIFGLKAPDVLLTVLLASLIPAVLVALWDRTRDPAGPAGADHLWGAAAWALGGPALLLGAHGSVWFTAQIAGALFVCLHLLFAWDLRRPALAGLCLGLAVSCRPHLLLALPFAALEWWRVRKEQDDGGLRSGLAFALPLGVLGLLLAAHNYARFEDIFEFGHRYLDIRWQRRMQEVGQFSPRYLVRNLQCLLTLAPQLQAGFPFFKVSVHGMALPLASPWVLGLAGVAWGPLRAHAEDGAGQPQRLGLVLAAAAVAVLPLLYHNSGQLQFTYRFALDWLPMLLTVLVLGSGLRPWWSRALVLAAIALHLHGAWYFARDPKTLFVIDPRGWPFEAELKG